MTPAAPQVPLACAEVLGVDVRDLCRELFGAGRAAGFRTREEQEAFEARIAAKPVPNTRWTSHTLERPADAASARGLRRRSA